MIEYKYGEFDNNQFEKAKKNMQKKIFFLLLFVDPKTKEEYPNVDVVQAFNSILTKFAGLNELLFCPPELVRVMSLLEAGLIEYKKENFNFQIYRKLVLEAGHEVLKIKGV